MSVSSLRLIDVLRRRRRLAPPEVRRLVAELPAHLDSETTPPLGADALLHSISFRFKGQLTSNVSDEMIGLEVTRWEPFHLEVAPPAGETASGDGTGIDLAASGDGKRPAAMAGVLYELLGGSRRYQRAHFAPLPCLNESANNVLRSAIERRAEFSSCTALWLKFLEAVDPPQEKPVPRPPVWHIRHSAPIADHQAAALSITPTNGEHPPISISAHPQFRIGRSRAMSDFPVRFARTPGEDAHNIKALSRVHVLLERHGVEVTLRDGDGKKPSVNGSTYRGHPLDCEKPTPLEAGGVLVLSGAYRLKVTPVQSPADPIEPIDFRSWKKNAGLPSGDLQMPGGLLFQPLDGHPTMRHTAWLFSEVGLRVTPRSGAAWSESAAAPVWILLRLNALWIANALPAAGGVCLDGVPLATREIVPLAGKHTLQIGHAEFEISVQ